MQNNMDDNTIKLCKMIRNRSDENRQAIQSFPKISGVLSPAFSILRQELDSLIRVIYLLSLKNLTERRRLINSTLSGKKWKISTTKGKLKEVTDRDMIDQAQNLQGWTQSVYKFGCSFIHLSDFHNHLEKNPLSMLPELEKQNILKHMRNYHDGPLNDNPDIEELSRYLPQIFDKIASNLRCYLEQLEREESIEI